MKETLLCSTTWINLEGTMLSDISQAQMTNTARLHFSVDSEVELTEAESSGFPGPEGGSIGEILVKRHKVLVM
jgi:hypothetical protein